MIVHLSGDSKEQDLLSYFPDLENHVPKHTSFPITLFTPDSAARGNSPTFG